MQTMENIFQNLLQKMGDVRPYNITIEPELFYALANEASRTGISFVCNLSHISLKSSIKNSARRFD